MIKYAIQGVATVSIVAIMVFILRLVVWQIKRIQTELQLMQAHELREVLEDFTEKIVRIEKQKNGGKVLIDEAQGMLADALREAGLDPSQYFLEGLIQAKQHQIEEKERGPRPQKQAIQKPKSNPEAGSKTF